MQPGRHLILYDRDCGFCRWSLGWILRWDRRRRLEPLAIQDPAAQAALAGLGEEERMASWHLIGPDGERRSAGAALAPLLRLLPGGAPPAVLLEAFPVLAERGYALVASQRKLLGRGITKGAAARADELIGRRRREAEADESGRLSPYRESRRTNGGSVR